jgi:hypothetical protein
MKYFLSILNIFVIIGILILHFLTKESRSFEISKLISDIVYYFVREFFILLGFVEIIYSLYIILKEKSSKFKDILLIASAFILIFMIFYFANTFNIA